MRIQISCLLIAAAVLCAAPGARADETGNYAGDRYSAGSSTQAAPENAQPAEGGAGLQSGSPVSAPPARGSGRKSGAGKRGNSGSPAAAAGQGVNKDLSGRVMQRASSVSLEINRSGGYRMDGRNDCYGFVRRTWDPELKALGQRALPVSDYASRDWAPISSWSALVPGDVLSTHQGHMWGPNWHGGLFSGIVGGKPYSFDNSPSNRGGAYPRPAPSGVFRYYYIPTHKLLTGQAGKK